MTEKEQKIQAGKDKIKANIASDNQTRLEAETAIKEKRALEIAKRRSELIAAEEAAKAKEAEDAAKAEEAKKAEEKK